MTNNFASDLMMALVPGTVAGYYAGLLTAKQSKFSALKSEALRCVRSINYIGDEQQTDLHKTERSEELYLIASEFLQLKHRRAGENLLTIAGEVAKLVASCQMSSVPVQGVMSNITQWQERIRALRPGLRFFLPWGKI
jgi:DNA polymerase III delta subunit